jgi:hypothetical protein
MKIQSVAIEHVHLIWGAVAPYLQASLDSTGVNEYTLDQVKMRIADGAWQLMVAVDDNNVIQGAGTVRFFNRPNERVGYIDMVGGKLITGEAEFEQLKTFMALNGATCIEASARESAARLFSRHGFAEKYRVIGVKL